MQQSFLPNGVRAERTGWRDADVSARHRMWGFNCPAVDLDFLMVEYNIGKPVGIVEYKFHKSQQPLNLNHPTYRALRELADVAGLPFLIAYYWKEIWAFRIVPVNVVAQQTFTENQVMTERQFVMALYRLRRLVLTQEIEQHLMDELPPDQEA